MPRKTIQLGSPHYEYDFSNDFGPFENGMGYAIANFISMGDRAQQARDRDQHDEMENELMRARIDALRAKGGGGYIGQLAPAHLIRELTMMTTGVDRHGKPTDDPTLMVKHVEVPRPDAERRLLRAGVDPKTRRFIQPVDVPEPPPEAKPAAIEPSLEEPDQLGPIGGAIVHALEHRFMPGNWLGVDPSASGEAPGDLPPRDDAQAAAPAAPAAPSVPAAIQAAASGRAAPAAAAAPPAPRGIAAALSGQPASVQDVPGYGAGDDLSSLSDMPPEFDGDGAGAAQEQSALAGRQAAANGRLEGQLDQQSTFHAQQIADLIQTKGRQAAAQWIAQMKADLGGGEDAEAFAQRVKDKVRAMAPPPAPVAPGVANAP